jgi:hypothetical protein
VPRAPWFNVPVAVRLDEETVRQAVDPHVLTAAEELVKSGALGELTEVGGGVACLVTTGTEAGYDVWVGVAAGALVGECSCDSSWNDPDDLCAHAVAVTLRALDDEFAWSSAAVPPSGAMHDPQIRRLAEIAASLPPRRLALLVAEYAVNDPRLATRLVTCAGVGAPLDDEEAAELRRRIDSSAGQALVGQWQLADVTDAAEQILMELEILVERPVNDEALLVIEHAAAVYDGLAGHLYDAGDRYADSADVFGNALRGLHIRMCLDLDVNPEELVDRIAAIVARAPAVSCLDEPDEYLEVLGPDEVEALRERAVPTDS